MRSTLEPHWNTLHAVRPSAIRGTGVMECRAGDYSALMPANLTTVAHFSVSSAMNFPNSAGDPANTAHPRSVSRLAPALDRITKAGSQVLIVQPNGLFINQRKAILRQALAAALPTIFDDRGDVEAGGFMAARARGSDGAAVCGAGFSRPHASPHAVAEAPFG
jgi:hypothetical protein